MKHLALYRKYRPKTFEGVIGQDHITKTLVNQIVRDEISHAYLFNGTRGTGKTSTAKIFAKAINCLTPVNGSACLKCDVCKELEIESNLDVFEIDAASNNRVDEIRDLREKIKYPPVHGKYKVYIIDEVHMLTDSAFNALLKTLEEPPSHAVFVLATTEVHKLPATILSRVMRFDFKLVSVEDLMKLLTNIFKDAGIKCEEEALKTIALAGEGSVRDSLSIADMCASYSGNNITYQDVLNALGTTTKSVLINITNAIINKDTKVLLEEIDKSANEGKNISVLTKDLTNHFRDLLVIKSVKTAIDMLALPKDIFESMKEQAKKESADNLLFYMQKLSSVENELKYSSNERLLLETATLSCTLEDVPTIKNLEERISKIEQTLKKGSRQLKKTTPLVAPEHKVVVNEQNKLSSINKAVEKLEKTVKQIEEPVNNTNKYENINISQLWGKVLIALKEGGNISLYTASGGVKPVRLNSTAFTAHVDNAVAFRTLNNPSNIKIIEELFIKENVDVKLDLVFNKQIKEEKDITLKMLEQKFGKYLKIIN